MSVATVAGNKGGKRPQYKDYVSFLGNYKNGKKEDQTSIITVDSGVSLSLSNSSNNSSSSVYSDLTDAPKSSFKEYLENYNSKRYSPVQPPVLVKKQGDQQEAETKTVKTEVFLEIHSPPSTVTKVVDVTNGHGVRKVGKVSKIFENGPQNESNIVKTVPPSGKVNTFNFGQKEADTKHEQRKISMGGVPKNHHKVPLKKAHSISEKSKVFEDTNNTLNEPEQPAKTNGCLSPKPLIHAAKPVFISKAKTEDNIPRTNGSTSPKPLVTIKPIVVPKAISEALTFHQAQDSPMTKTDAPLVSNAKPVNAPKTVIETIHLEVNTSAPVPPPLPPSFQQEQRVYSPPTCPPPPPPVPQPFQGGANAPPPPPPPPANFSPKKVQYSPPKTSVPTQKVVVNGGARKSDIVDGTAAPVIDKNDPRVKKLVYGALREMYGAYHDKANDYIATLPRNRVKKNNGLDSIISSIASQGGLEKLNGRVNPTVETD